ncbi:protein kinase N [Paragonimus westermani]|uniref:Protein kinase N n=1 Tax=Paragonimus westermani TaxID=34504 RepID=A0A5J4NL92_9TREM|nr:protein kinase N [Paragonimus westermani]
MEHDAYARELAGLYGIDPTLSYSELVDEFKKLLESKKARLQKLYKMKAGVHKIEDARVGGRPTNEHLGGSALTSQKEASTLDRRSSRLATTDLIKDINVEVQDLIQDIGDLETSILYLKHSTTNSISLTSSTNSTFNNENLADDKVAELQKALDIELQVKSGAQRLVETYKMGPRNVLEEAKRQFDSANKKIGFIRNQLIRVKQLTDTTQQSADSLKNTAASTPPHSGDVKGLSNGTLSSSLACRDPIVLWKAKVFDLVHRCRVERAVLDGSRKAVHAMLDGQTHADKARKMAALQNARESLHKLYLIQLSLKSLLEKPPAVTSEITAICQAPELSNLVDSVWTSHMPGKVSSVLQTPNAPTAVTGSLEVRCFGCQDVLDTFPSEIVYNDVTADVRCCLLLDHKRVWESNWRSPGQHCWDAQTTFNVDQAKELQVQVFWRRVFPPPGSPSVSYGSSNTLTTSGTLGRSSVGSATDGTAMGLDWVLGAVTYLRLEDFLGCQSSPLVLEMMPRGNVFMILKFTDPVLAKPAARLRRQNRLFSKRKAFAHAVLFLSVCYKIGRCSVALHKPTFNMFLGFIGRDIPRSSEMNINVRLWARLLKSGQLLSLNRATLSGSATLNRPAEPGHLSSTTQTSTLMGHEGRYQAFDTPQRGAPVSPTPSQVTISRTLLALPASRPSLHTHRVRTPSMSRLPTRLTSKQSGFSTLPIIGRSGKSLPIVRDRRHSLESASCRRLPVVQRTVSVVSRAPSCQRPEPDNFRTVSVKSRTPPATFSPVIERIINIPGRPQNSVDDGQRDELPSCILSDSIIHIKSSSSDNLNISSLPISSHDSLPTSPVGAVRDSLVRQTSGAGLVSTDTFIQADTLIDLDVRKRDSSLRPSDSDFHSSRQSQGSDIVEHGEEHTIISPPRRVSERVAHGEGIIIIIIIIIHFLFSPTLYMYIDRADWCLVKM